jgi:membrane-bound lytic murein transglycosylase MltF
VNQIQARIGLKFFLPAFLAVSASQQSAAEPRAPVQHFSEQRAVAQCATKLAADATPAPADAPAAKGVEAPAAPPAEKRTLAIANKPWTGDFDKLLARKMIRVLVPYSRTLYFTDKGHEKGITADNVRDFERYINKKYVKDKRPVTVYLIPTTRDKLLTEVAAGLGDIAAGNITITDERREVVDFVVQGKHDQDELIVTGPNAPPLQTLDDLAGKTVHVRRSTSYYESLVALNARFVEAGKPQMVLAPLPHALEDEDKLEMLNAGIVDIVVVDDWLAKMWAQVLPKIVVHENLKLREGGKIGWAVRKDSPKLTDAIQDFFESYIVKQGVGAYRLAQYMKRVKQIRDPTASTEWKRFEETLALFRTYGHKYNFDPLMLAAQGYQESRLDQNAKSRVGAVGVMQLMPATGKELAVGDIRKLEPNIHAGAKYIDGLMTKYFPDAKFTAGNRPLFAFASYNAGPGRIRQMRTEAAKRGLDPDKWFNNVEVVTAEKVGIETTTYVRNIYKYYVAYRLTLEADEAKQKAREQVQRAGEP